ncbi:MAG: PHP domain-containing protein [Anaerolineae bacterium]
MTSPKTQEYLHKPDNLNLVDTHCHTEYAYCARTVTAKDNIAASKTSGLHGLCLIEHAFQLYFDEDDAWNWKWQTDDALVQKAWETGRGRMPEYRKFAQGLRDQHDGYVRLGLEVDLRADGSLLLAEEDMRDWDMLIGSVHYIHDFDKDHTTPAQAERLFLRETERLLAQPIQVIAHPFRFLYHAKVKCSPLYKTVARWLAQSGVAAELNFHWNKPDPRFIEMCLSHGVKIALATDSHDLAEVGELSLHINLLRQLGICERDLPDVLYQPD